MVLFSQNFYIFVLSNKPKGKTMFLEMFAASALAQIIFGGNNSSSTASRNYTNYFNTPSTKSDIDSLNKHCDAMHNDIKFIKARMCLEHFSIKFFDNIQLTIKRHTAEDIIAAATEGFEELCNIARIDDDDFKEARNKFKETFGNYDWVNAHYHDRIDAAENFTIFTEDETAYYSQIFETIQKHENAITELENTCVLRFLKRKKLREQIQNTNMLATRCPGIKVTSSHMSYAHIDNRYAYFVLNSAAYAGDIDAHEHFYLEYMVKHIRF